MQRQHRIAEPSRIIERVLSTFPHVNREKAIKGIARIRWIGTDWEDEGAFLKRAFKIAIRNRRKIKPLV